MSKIYCPVGRYAANPYTIKNVSIKVYCIEELCYYIRHNALFIGEDFFDADLFTWMEEECDLLSLSRKIKVKIRQEGSVLAGIRELFDNVNYCDDAETEETMTLLRSNRDMSMKERLMIHGDYFLNNNRDALAAETYQELLLLLDKKKDMAMIAKVNYNLGVIFARLFLFDNAEEYFKLAYKMDHGKESLSGYLKCLRMRLSEENYLKALQEIDGAYEASSDVENEIENANSIYEETSEFAKVKELQKIKLEGNVSEFSKKAMNISVAYKNDYRYKMQK